MSDDIAIKVNKVSKDFLLPHEKNSSLKSTVVNVFKSKDKRVEKQHALKDISFEIKKGEFFGIVGRNGSGKSTLLKILAGVYQPTSGSVQVSGRLVPFIELGVGFNPELTGRENVYLNGALLGFSRKEISARYQDIVDFAELEKFMDQKLKNYSSGMQVRLAFSAATILAESDILLIDEVLAVGDADFQRKCFDYFKAVKKIHKTVVFVSHDMNAIREYCDRGILINDSRIELSGTSEQITGMYNRIFNEEDKDNAVLDTGVETATESGDSEKRWGSRQVEIIKKPKIEVGDKFINLKIDLKNSLKGQKVICGFSIENQFGQVVMGSNTTIINKRYIPKHGSSTANFKLPNIFSTGTYLVTIALLAEDGQTTYDWWSGCASFKIKNTFNTPYVTSPEVEFKSI